MAYATKHNPQPRFMKNPGHFKKELEAEVAELGVDVQEARSLAKSMRMSLIDVALMLATGML